MSKPKCTDPEILEARRKRRNELANIRQRKFYSENREKMIELQKARNQTNPLQSLLGAIKARAKKDGVEFDLTVEDFPEIPSVCPVLGIPIAFNQSMTTRPNSISVDRFDPKQGYVKGNVFLVSQRANRLKSDASIQELEKILLYMRSR